MNKKTQEVKELIALLGFDYDRMSSSGQETYDKICDLLNIGEE